MSGRNRVPGRSVTSKVFAILDAFTPDEPVHSLTELARRCDLPAPTALRLVRELVGWGALERLPDGRYTVGPRLTEFDFRDQNEHRLREVALPFMAELYEATRETVHLGVVDGLGVRYIEKFHGPRSQPVASRVEGVLPLHATSIGQVLLAHSPAELVDQIVAQGLPALTPCTITEPEQLWIRLAQIRSKGYVVTIDEMTVGRTSIAAPVRTVGERVVAALSIVVPTTGGHHPHLVPAVVGAAQRLSRQLGAHR
ncbi:MAG TPA: IclR family transcriptional regulator [Pseudonocardiaceae bacterium]